MKKILLATLLGALVLPAAPSHARECSPDPGDPVGCRVQDVQDAVDSVVDFVQSTDLLDTRLLCPALKTAGAPAIVNVTTPVSGYHMDADDCDLWYGSEREIDLSPYQD